ncbi:adenine deaminase [Elstera litoralis]|uniref:Adenine deaminase n=1 Tax=Elstera litoralis TaxID=552518 RepID=A0A0F3IUD8_9PROT|nr:adenine deaminase [Elstera litoralis]KJV10321.1 adenine deaminase [Elstera litoralis]
MTVSKADIARRIDQALGTEKADLVIKNVRLLDVVSGTLHRSDIAICGDKIVGTFDEYSGVREIDGSDQVAVPGFIDAHVHVESSLVTPGEFDRCVLPRGTTTAVCDPHEISNVLGEAGLRYFLEASDALVMDLRVQLSSCVPATGLETSGATLGASVLHKYKNHPRTLGLAEFMNYPGLFAKDGEVLEKLADFSDTHIDGHAPLVRGKDLNAYLSAGIRNCHETTSADEAREKLSKGMQVLIRDGSVSRDVAALTPILNARTAPFCGFCTDDRNPLEIAQEGHMDHLIRTAIALGADPADAYRAASWSSAQHFGLRDRGLIAPGWRADIVLLDDYASCTVGSVIQAGKLITPESFEGRNLPEIVGLNSVKLDPVTASHFAHPAAAATQPVIGVLPGKIVTEFRTATLAFGSDGLKADPDQDVLKIAVLARHGVNRNIGRGFVQGFGFKAGALASSVGHDSHNICVVGTNEADMAAAVNRVIALGGGFVAVKDGAVLAELPLPVAGLMSLLPFEGVDAQLQSLRAAVKAMGCPLDEPFLQLAFLPLPVIPHLKITDFGLVDVDRFRLIA